MTIDFGKYSKPERERRLLLEAVPSDAIGGLRIVDRYLDGTRLRLRQVGEGPRTVLKLGQKIRPDEADPRLVQHTSIYLSGGEFALLATLPGRTMTKHRSWVLLPDGLRMAVDAFDGELAGLVLGEFEFPDAMAADSFRPFPWVLAEVSLDDRFTGGQLAATGREALRAAIADVAGSSMAVHLLDARQGGGP